MRVIISGSRDWNWFPIFEKAMNDVLAEWQVKYSLETKDIGIIHGGARGVDTMAQKYADKLGIKTKVFLANWDNIDVKKAKIETRPTDGSMFNKVAGVQRNIKMLDFINNSKHKCVVAFQKDNSSGTAHMIGASKRAGIPLYHFKITFGVKLELEVYNFDSVLVNKYR